MGRNFKECDKNKFGYLTDRYYIDKFELLLLKFYKVLETNIRLIIKNF